MKLIVFATHEEAKHTIKRLQARQVDDHYLFTDGILVITGIGPFAAYTSLEKHIEKATCLYNFGLAGSLQKRAESCYEIRLCSKYAWHPITPGFHEPITFKNAGLRLCTLDFPLYDEKKKDLLGADFDLVDMEGYAISLLAKRHNKACKLIKAVSDFCNTDSPTAIKKKIDTFSEEFAHWAY